MEIKTICCDKEMIELNVYNLLPSNIDTIRFICGICGKITDINTYALDDEELLNEIENNDELQNTEIHKELMKK